MKSILSKLKIILIIGILLISGLLTGQVNSTLSAEIVINADHGWPVKVIIRGDVIEEQAWLGISLYPYGVADPETGGRHSSIEMKKGHFTREITIDQPLLGGSFEVGLWGTKVDKVDCTLDYCYWCKVNGFHFENLLAYKSGLLNKMTGY